MRNVLLAAVSAVTILGSTPEAQAIAAAKQYPLIVNGNQIVFTEHDHDGHHLWIAHQGHYWLVAHHGHIGKVPFWKSETIDGKLMHIYAVGYDPYDKTYGLLMHPYAHWAAYNYYVVPHMMDAVLDNAVEAPYNVKETKVK